MIKKLAHANIISHDLAASEHFYCEILGLKKAFEFYKNEELFGFYIATGDLTFIEIFVQQEPANTERPLIRHLCLEVEDIDTVISDIRSKGWEITDKKQGSDQSWQCWITDPDGVRLELMEYTDTSSQYTGADCIVTW